MKIIVLDIRLQNNGKPLKAFADIQLDNSLVIKDFRIMQHNGQKAYVVSPQTSWRGQEGKIQFKTILTMPNGLKWQIESTILAEYQRAKELQSENTA